MTFSVAILHDPKIASLKPDNHGPGMLCVQS